LRFCVCVIICDLSRSHLPGFVWVSEAQLKNECRLLVPQSQGLRKWNVYRVKVEIDVSVAGQRSTYVFNCIHSGQATVIQPLGMR
jgi:hypothetical protein